MSDEFLNPRTVSFINYFYNFINRYDENIKIRFTIDQTYSDTYLKMFGKDIEVTVQKGNKFARCMYDINELPTDLDTVDDLAFKLIQRLKTIY